MAQLIGGLEKPSDSISISSPPYVNSSKIRPQMLTISRLSLNFRYNIHTNCPLNFRLCPK